MKKSVELPSAVADEIALVAKKMHRSSAFIAARALAAGKSAPPVALAPPLVRVDLESDEDDAPKQLAPLKTASAPAIASAWAATRARFMALVERHAEADEKARADDLDAALADAADARTAPPRLVELARSEYVRVRTLVARHPHLPDEALALLRGDKDRVVQEALGART